MLKTLMIAGLASLIALPALAKRDPKTPPSGIVIHLFGPHLITDSSDKQTTPTVSTPEPSMGEVLHEMFVTGDPAQQGKASFPKGRAQAN